MGVGPPGAATYQGTLGTLILWLGRAPDRKGDSPMHARCRPSFVLVLAAMTVAMLLAGPAGSALAADPSGVGFKLEGCRNNGTVVLPNGSGKFICPDAAYTTGNLGKGWNELDLVPFRLTANAGNSAPSGQTYTMAVVLDSKDSGHPGYGVLSVPVLNTALSRAGCTAPPVGAETTADLGGGIDESRYRLVTITQAKSTTCVYDYFGRLALGSHLFSGASLHANLADEDLGGASKEVSIPVNEIAPQELSKDMSATQDSDHAWDVTKSPTPASLSFADTCDPNGALSKGVQIKITWEKKAATPSGPITVITHVYAKNPAARTITVDVIDSIRSGTTELDSASAGPIDLPANTEQLVLTHQTEVPAGTTNLNDVATAGYKDKVTGVPIPGTTTATASANVQASGVEKNQTATVNDVESISGPFSFSADSFSAASGSFDGGYVAGTKTTGDVSWTSDSQAATGSVTFDKTVYTTSGSSSSGKLSDTATLTGSDGFSDSADLDVGLESSARVSLKIEKTIPNVLSGSESQRFTFHVKDSNGVEVAQKTLTFNAGDTAKDVTVGNLAPDTYTVSEDTATGWSPQADKTANLNLPTCSGSVKFQNGFSPASASAAKVTDPKGSEGGWEMILSGPGTPAGGEKVTTDAGGDAPFVTSLQQGSYTITETAKDGWDQTGTSGACSFTVNYPADSGKAYKCTITNTQRGKIVVKKTTDPAGSAQEFSFSSDYGDPFKLTDGTSNDSGYLKPGTYKVGETVPAGWDQTSASCDDKSDPGAIDLAAGETVTCTFKDTQQGKITVKKTTDPTGDTTKFAFTGDLAGSIGNGEQIGPTSVKFETNDTTETLPSGWDLTGIKCSDSDSGADATNAKKAVYKVAAGEDVTCTYSNRKRGHLKVIKTVSGVTPPATSTQTFTFTLRSGATQIIGHPGTVLETKTISSATGWQASFATDLVPGDTYQICEQLPGAGWSLTFGGLSQFTSEQYLADGVTINPAVDNSLRCANFTVTAGQTRDLTVDNGPPPGGLALTIGYWKNWSSCTGGGQQPVLDQTLASFPIASGQTLHGVFIGKLYVTNCQTAVAVLGKSDVKSGKKMSSDPLYNMAAQLLAVELNLQKGSVVCNGLAQKRTDAQTYLNKYSWNGTGAYKESAADAAAINALGTYFDRYNNDLIC